MSVQLRGEGFFKTLEVNFGRVNKSMIIKHEVLTKFDSVLRGANR